MGKFSRQEMDRLWQEQLAREAQDRDEFRTFVSTVKPPLPAELVRNIIRLNDQYVRYILEKHQGYELSQRKISYLKSLDIFKLCIDHLLKNIKKFESDALKESSNLFLQGGEKRLAHYEIVIQKELFACANAAASLVDHGRRVNKVINISNFSIKRRELIGEDGLHEFIITLRVMLHHLEVISADWITTTDYSFGKIASFTISRNKFEKIIELYPDQFQRSADSAMRNYISLQPGRLDIAGIFSEYRTRLSKFNEWLKSEIQSPSLVALHDYESILEKKVKSDHLL